MSDDKSLSDARDALRELYVSTAHKLREVFVTADKVLEISEGKKNA